MAATNSGFDFSKEKIKFSFEFYDGASDDYCLSKWPQEQIKNSLLRLKELNGKSFQELRRDSRVLHFGEVDWSKTIKPAGFPDKRANVLPPFHFSLLNVNGQKARVFGAYSAGTFFVVWFDIEHMIWPTFKKNT